MIGAFNFNGIDSSTFSLVCKSVKRPLLPAAKQRRIELPNSSGVYDYPGLEYSIRNLTMRITYLGNNFEELRSRAREIASWLSIPDQNWAILIINDEPDKYYLAKITSETDMTTMYEAGEAELNFDCQPYAYSIEPIVADFLDITSQFECEFEHPGTRVINYKSPYGSQFTIDIEGSWTTLTLNLNGKTLGYTAAATNKKLRILNVEMEALLYDGANSSNAFGDLDQSFDTFLSVIPGDNVLTIGGTNLNVDVSVEFIPLWI